MQESDSLYTVGLWSVKPGKEDDFISLWDGFAKWTSEHQTGAAQAFLLQDMEQHHRFISFGPWDSAQSIQAWRAQPEFKNFIAKAREICDEIKPGNFKLVAEIANR